jgi:alanine racemase
MSLIAPIIAIKTLRQGDTVGYGSQWMAEKKCRIAVVAVGYADGYPREVTMGTPVLINGKRRRLIGRVSMDMLTVELQDEDIVAIGDSVELWGKNLPVEEISVCAGTIPYTLMCAVSRRVPREYSGHHGFEDMVLNN